MMQYQHTHFNIFYFLHIINISYIVLILAFYIYDVWINKQNDYNNFKIIKNLKAVCAFRMPKDIGISPIFSLNLPVYISSILWNLTAIEGNYSTTMQQIL